MIVAFSMFLCNESIAEPNMNLKDSVIIVPADGSLGKAADFLSDEVYKRTKIRWYLREPFDGAIRIVLCTKDRLPKNFVLPPDIEIPSQNEGFSISIEKGKVIVLGFDEKGVLFGIGRLLRILEMRKGSIFVENNINIKESPKYSMRVHQLGYRNTATSYDLWDVDTYEQYIRELVIFGSNGIELIQESPPGEKDSVLMAEPQWDMNLKLSKLLDSYDLDVYLWYPVPILDTDQGKYQREIGYRKQFFREMPRINHLFVPGGDPGDNHPKVLMPALEIMAGLLHERFPDAGVYVSNQKMKPELNDWFFNYIRTEQPTWLAGYAYGPGTKHSIMDARKWLPKQYSIRRYPDITHNLRSQFPVPHWDGQMAQALGREGINPRPGHNQNAHNAYDEYAEGFGSYSDGIHDDLNKMVWSALAWDPEADIHELVIDYGRVYFGEDVGQDVADGLWMLQDNMKGNFLKNTTIPKTLAKWREIGEEVSPEVRNSWRYQMYLMRAIFDHYTRERYIAHMAYEKAVYGVLAKASTTGSMSAMSNARNEFAQADSIKIGQDLREEMELLADSMFHSIGYQFSIHPPYFTRNAERGALLDKLDIPMNDRPWLENQFDRIAKLETEEERLHEIDKLVNWEDPGPGGFYDDLGNPDKQPHLNMLSSYDENPSRIDRITEGHYRWMNNQTLEVDNRYRFSWLHYAQSLHGAPLILRYDGLDPDASYSVKVVEFGRFGASIDLIADNKYQIHGPLRPQYPLWPIEYEIPKAATQDGKVELKWRLVEGRGTQVAEVWLIKKE